MAITLNGELYATLAEAIAKANEADGTYVITVDSTSPNIISDASKDVPCVASGTIITIDGVGDGAGSATLVASSGCAVESLLTVLDGGVLNIRDVTIDADGADVNVGVAYLGGDGTIENVRFTNVSIQEGPYYVGGIGVALGDGADVTMKDVAFDHMGSAGVVAGSSGFDPIFSSQVADAPAAVGITLSIDGFSYTGSGVSSIKSDVGILVGGAVTATIQNATIQDNISSISPIYSLYSSSLFGGLLNGGIIVVGSSADEPTSVTIGNTSVANSSSALTVIGTLEEGVTINLLGGNEFAGNTVHQNSLLAFLVGTSDAKADVLILGEATVNGVEGVDGTILWDSSPFYGLGGDDMDGNVVAGGAGDDHLSGGLGADTLTGNGGSDEFFGFAVEFDGDTITDIQDGETILVADAITPTATLVGETLTIDIDGDAATTDDQSTMTLAGASGMVTVEGNIITYVSATPRLAVPLADQAADEDKAFAFTIPADAFGSLEAAAAVGRTITYSATLANGAALPGWLAFDPATRTFSGTPADANVGAIEVKVSVTDGTTTVSDTFSLTVKDDHVFTAANSYSLLGTPLVEELTFTGTGNFVGTGNALDNEITGGAGNDTLNGLGGNDRMVGGAGDDTYAVAEAGDVVVEAVGGGIDFVQSSRSLTLGANVENLTLTDAGGEIDGTGNGLDNVIIGNAFENTLVGGDGADTLMGGEGKDILHGDEGADLISGGAGRDSLHGGTGADRFDFDAIGESRVGRGRDVIRDFRNGVDEIDLRTIDADVDADGDQRFSWVSRRNLDAEFSGEAGELRFADGILSGDVDGDGRADFQIKVVGNLFLGDVTL